MPLIMQIIPLVRVVVETGIIALYPLLAVEIVDGEIRLAKRPPVQNGEWILVDGLERPPRVYRRPPAVFGQQLICLVGERATQPAGGVFVQVTVDRFRGAAFLVAELQVVRFYEGGSGPVASPPGNGISKLVYQKLGCRPYGHTADRETRVRRGGGD